MEDRPTRCAVRQNQWRRRSCRQLPELCLRNRRDLCYALLNVRGWLEEHLDNSDSVQRLRFDVLNIIDGSGKRPLCDANNTVTHLLRDEAVIVPDDADNRNIDGRKNVGWRADNREPTQDQDEYGRYHERVGPPQC